MVAGVVLSLVACCLSRVACRVSLVACRLSLTIPFLSPAITRLVRVIHVAAPASALVDCPDKPCNDGGGCGGSGLESVSSPFPLVPAEAGIQRGGEWRYREVRS